MRKKRIITGLVIIVVVALASFFLLKSPPYSAEDFQNEERVLFNERFPEEELRLRGEELAEAEPPREGENPAEAAADAMSDYVRAGLYGEALRVSREVEAQFSDDASYFELKGDLLAAMRQYRDAVESYSRSLELGGDRANIYAKLGDLYLFHTELEDKTKKARALYKKAASLTVDPEEVRSLRVKAEALQ